MYSHIPLRFAFCFGLLQNLSARNGPQFVSTHLHKCLLNRTDANLCTQWWRIILQSFYNTMKLFIKRQQKLGATTTSTSFPLDSVRNFQNKWCLPNQGHCQCFLNTGQDRRTVSWSIERPSPFSWRTSNKRWSRSSWQPPSFFRSRMADSSLPKPNQYATGYPEFLFRFAFSFDRTQRVFFIW